MIYQVQNMQITKSHTKFASQHMQKWFCILQIDLAFTVISTYNKNDNIHKQQSSKKSNYLYLNQGPRKSCFPLNLTDRQIYIRTDIRTKDGHQYLQSSIATENCPEIPGLIFYTKSGLLALQDDGKREREKDRE